MTPDAFKHTIREHPQDDGPRLIFADWLEEHGDCDYAEFIRVQCELEQPLDDDRWAALSRREAELLALHREEWLGPWRLSRPVQLRRGFLEAEIDAEEALRLSEEFWRAPALLELTVARLHLYPETIERLIAWPGREFITGLEPSWRLNRSDWDELRRFLTCNWPRLTVLTLPPIAFSAGEIDSLSSMPDLKRLKLRDFRLPPSSGEWQSVLSSPIVDRLTAIELEDTPLSEAESHELARICRSAPSLRQLTLNKCRVGANEFKRFLQSAELPQLTHLDLTGNPLRDSGIRLLADFVGLQSLTELNLNACECGKPGVQSLLDSGLMRRLTALHLNDNFLGDAAARMLLTSGEIDSIRLISLGSDLTDNGLGFIANSPAVSRWRELTVQGSSFTAAGLLTLLRSTELANLSSLTLAGLSLHLGHLPNLNRKPFTSRLRALTIRPEEFPGGRDALSRDSVVNLLSSPSLPRLRRLRVPSVWPAEAIDGLQNQFGHRFECDTPPLMHRDA